MIVAENAQREKFLTLEGACQHKGDVVIWREVYDGVTDNSTEYGTCMACKAKLVITIWLGRAKDEQCYDVRLMTPTEVSLLCPSNS